MVEHQVSLRRRMRIHPLLSFCFLFLIYLSVSASAGNLLTTHTHFEIDDGLDYLHVLTSTVKLVLGFGTPYLIANLVIIVITLLNIIVYKLLELQDENSDSDQKSSSSTSVNLNLSSEKQLCRFFSLDEIVSATNNFDESLVIGKGGFGKVYKGVIDNGSCTVAIKRLNSLSKQGASEFWAEIKMLSKFRHSHLVSLIGYCDQNNEMILVYEFMIHGSLDNHLHKISKNEKSIILSWVQRLKICIGAARGLDYLHTGTAVVERVIHRDVKSSNILLDKNWAAKISDFGLSRTGPADQDSTHVSTKHIKGTFGYMDPDYFLTRRFTRKYDVYAFGVVLLEVLSERPALDRSLLDEDQWSLAGWGQQCINDGVSHHLIGPNLKWEILQTSLVEFLQIAGQCLHSRPKKRPTMSEVVAKLELALALQLRTNELMDDDLLVNDWPFGSPKNTDSSSKQHFQLETPVIFENSNAQSNDESGDTITFPNRAVDVIQDMPTSGKIVTPNLRFYTFAELKTITNNFTFGALGDGGAGSVYRGWVEEKPACLLEVGIRKAVAVRKLLSGALAQGMMEVEILGKFSHPNFVKLLGYYVRVKDGEFILVYDYMPNGSLNHHLYGIGAKPLPWNTRLRIAIGAASAVSFLHATENQVIVRNIKSSNILIDADFNARLSNFGTATRGSESGKIQSSALAFPFFFYPPEYITTGVASLKSDIYGFGVVLLEILTGLKVFDKSRQGKVNLVEWALPLLLHKKSLWREIVDPKLGNDYPRQGALELASLILECLKTDPELRPSMKQVLHTLQQITSIEWKPKVEHVEENQAINMPLEEAQASLPTIQTKVNAYKILWSWTRNLRRSNS